MTRIIFTRPQTEAMHDLNVETRHCSAFLQRRALIRIYAYLASLSAILVTLDDLKKECVALAAAGWLGSKSTFVHPPFLSRFLTTALSEDAQILWSAESVSQVVSSALFYILPSAVYCVVAYVYHRQTADPTHPANLASQGSAIRLEARGGGAALRDAFSGVPARRPAKRWPTVSPPSYQAAVAVALLAVTSLSPGPPSFSVAGMKDADTYHKLSAGSEDNAGGYMNYVLKVDHRVDMAAFEHHRPILNGRERAFNAL
ncbi:hypothetical protein B0H19DRAFT_1247954 [Mycena capillaripes]|nr:hypothetical protein B0H19DRAFT_1247954 [Mycena capillaripes]